MKRTCRPDWQFVVFGHNEHEITKAREMAAELGMEIASEAQLGRQFLAGQRRGRGARGSGVRSGLKG